VILVGIDPGVSGGIAKIEGVNVTLFSFRDHTIQDLVGLFAVVFARGQGEMFVMLERVHAMPSTFRGCSTSWTLAENFSTIKTLLAVHEVPYEMVPPEKWQLALGCRWPKSVKYGKRKKLLREKAQALFPKVPSINKDTADALLLAEYNRRTHR
jgi:hypothetical protein